MRETTVLKAIMLELGNEDDFVLWRNNTGGLPTEDGGFVTFGIGTGSADLIGILAPRGRLIAIEVKRFAPGSKQRKSQIRWQAIVESLGGFYAVARSPQEARAALDRARREG